MGHTATSFDIPYGALIVTKVVDLFPSLIKLIYVWLCMALFGGRLTSLAPISLGGFVTWSVTGRCCGGARCGWTLQGPISVTLPQSEEHCAHGPHWKPNISWNRWLWELGRLGAHGLPLTMKTWGGVALCATACAFVTLPTREDDNVNYYSHCPPCHLKPSPVQLKYCLRKETCHIRSIKKSIVSGRNVIYWLMI